MSQERIQKQQTPAEGNLHEILKGLLARGPRFASSEEDVQRLGEALFNPQLRVEMLQRGMTMRNVVAKVKEGRVVIDVEVHKGPHFDYTSPGAVRRIRLEYEEGNTPRLIVDDNYDSITPIRDIQLPETIEETAKTIRELALNNLWQDADTEAVS